MAAAATACKRDGGEPGHGTATLADACPGRYIAGMSDHPTALAADVSDPSAALAAVPQAAVPILIAPHPILRRKTRPVRPEDAALLRSLLPGMFEAMYRAPGIGLAAPQVGVDLRFAIVDLHENDARQPITLINPEVVRASDQLVAREEGCLSLPNQYAEVVRPEKVCVRYRDVDGRRHELEADGLLATCLQHENDHLDGVLFVDHLSSLKRNMIMRRLAKEQKAKE